MAILPILQYPDERLKQVSPPISDIDESITSLIDDLLETLYDSPGCVGIASPQVGALKRLVIIDASRNAKAGENHGRMILINPEILSSEGEVIAREGCLSLPHLTANVKRAQYIRVRAQNEKGEWWEFDASNFEARVVLHEMDHLDGLLFLDRVASLKTDVFRRKRYNVLDEKTSFSQEKTPQV
ncbi:MAG: peptide deformylase [Cyanobacteria bacterium SZAS-4]|nr:peptide deformylase [Cyanobacteria bacterium SZAS-4]